ncbi:PE domain-containing protein, partial [Mycobacterium kansasii]
MTSMIAQPQLMADAAANIEGIRSAIAAANAAAAGPTTGLAAAAAPAGWAAGAARVGAAAPEYPAGLHPAAGVPDTS